MKRFFTFLMTVMALFVFATSVSAQEVYLRTKQMLNGVSGDLTHLMEPTGEENIYMFRVHSMPSDQFNFKVIVDGWKKEMQAHADNCQLPIYESTPADGDKYKIDDRSCWGDRNYWLVKDYSAYEELYVYVDINPTSGGKKYVWVEGKKKGSTPVTPSAKTIYMFTAETVNGVKGNYSTVAPIEEHKLSLVDGETTLYKYEVNSSDDNDFWFRFYIKDDNKQIQPQADKDPVTVTAAGASTSEYTNIYDGSSKAWKTTFDKSAYDKLTIYLDIATPRRLWIVGSKNSVVTEKEYVLVDNNGAEVSKNTTGSFVYNLTNATADAVVSFKIDGAAYGLTAPATITAAGTTSYTAAAGAAGTLTLAKGLKYDITIAEDGTVTVVATENAPIVTTSTGFYLVGNFFSKFNETPVTPGGDDDNINYTRRYFKFAQAKDGTFKVDIPACLTAKMQILGVDVDGITKVYGPGKMYGLHGKKDQASACPYTNGEVAGDLKSQPTLSENGNYWNLVTRNDGETDDDGMYTVSFTLNTDGTPAAWTITHDAKTRVAYLLNTAYGATAQPVYDKRATDTGNYTDNTEAYLHFDGKNGYFAIGYVVNDVNSPEQGAQAKKATPDIHATASLHNSSGTHDKLFFLGNDGSTQYDGKLWPNQPSFTLDIKGTKRVEYNPNRGDGNVVQKDGSYGMSGSFYIPDPTIVDYPSTISMVGDAIPGTTNADGSWNWASTEAKMMYDANERCYTITIETTDASHLKSFRFVGNHSQVYNWFEDTTTDEAMKAGCTHKNLTGHSCTPDDPNYLKYTTDGTNEFTEADNDIMWNRPAGIHTVKLYITTEVRSAVFKYTIETTANMTVPFTYRAGKFIRTYSNGEAMDIASPNVKAYEAYQYDAPAADDIYSKGTLHMRQLKYIPAKMGVVLIGEAPTDGMFSDGDKLGFSLRKRSTDDPIATTTTDYVDVWEKSADYVGQTWNNFLVPTVEANNSLGNLERDDDNNVTYRYYGLGNYHRTKYYKENKTGDDYIGFFRLTPQGRSGANKAYLRMPAKKELEGGAFGFIENNSQFIGANDETSASLAKMMIVFDDEMGGVTEIKHVEVEKNADNAYYTLQGVKVLRPTKGIFIHNGKKIVIK